jgi:hypothetical protein
MNQETMEVKIGPVEGSLDAVIEVGDTAVIAD